MPQDRSHYYMSRIDQGYAALSRGVTNTPLTKALARWGSYGPVIRVGDLDIPGAWESYLNGLREIVDAVDREDATAPYRFQRVGDIWHVRFDFEEGRFRDRKGFRHLSRLLAEEGRFVDSLLLTRGGVSGRDKRAAEVARTEGEKSFTYQGEFDERTAREALDRLAVLDVEAREARRRGDVDAEQRLFEERQGIADYLHGDDEWVLAEVRRQRWGADHPGVGRLAHKAVMKAISRALADLDRNGLRACARFLKRSIIPAGSSLIYSPLPPAPSWLL